VKRAKIQAIDVIKLYAQYDGKAWNKYLGDCYRKKDVHSLTDMMRRLQVGMDNAVKKNIVNEGLSVTFCRWIKSIENTLKMIYRDDNPNPLYDSRNVNKYSDNYLQEKRDLQIDFDKFLTKERF